MPIEHAGRAILVALLAAAPSFAQEPKRIGLKAGVETVAAEVDVLVTDETGRPAARLGKDDFRLIVDGRELQVDWVEAPLVAAPDSDTSAPTALPVPDPAVSAQPRLAHSTVLLIDDLHLDFAARSDGLAALRQLVSKLPPEEEVAVYVYRLGLKRLQPFTIDRAALLSALGRAGRTIPISANVGHFAEWNGRTQQLLDSVGWLFRSLANRPEPKTVVILAGPVARRPMRPQGMTRRGDMPGFESPTSGGRDLGLFDAYFYVREGEKVADEALLARATVVAIDPSGLRVDLTAESRSAPPRRSDPWNNAWAYRSDALALIARETGGARLGFANGTGKLVVHEAALLEQRYRLGFTPPEKGSARRDLRIEVRRPGLHVRAAAGQRTQTREAADRARFASLLLSDAPPKGDFEISAGPDKGAKPDDRTMPYEILVPMKELLLDETSKERVASLEFLFAAVDKEGRTSDVQARRVTLRIPPGDENAREATYRYSARITPPRSGSARLLIGVRDRTTSRLGLTYVDVKG